MNVPSVTRKFVLFLLEHFDSAAFEVSFDDVTNPSDLHQAQNDHGDHRQTGENTLNRVGPHYRFQSALKSACYFILVIITNGECGSQTWCKIYILHI